MKRFLRFRLSTFLIAFTIFAIWLGWYVHSVRQQQAAVAVIKRFGGWIYYDFQFVSGKFNPQAKSWVPDWLRTRLGTDFFHSVVRVNMVYNDDGPKRLDNGQVSGEALEYIRQLPRVEELLLKETQATDENLHYLKRLKRLRRLYMWDAADVSDVGIQQLAGLRNLQYVHCNGAHLTDFSLAIFGRMPNIEGLSLQGNSFTDRGLAHLKSLSNLKSLWLGMGDTRITDAGLKNVYVLKNLQEFEIQGAPVTASGLGELQIKLPKLKIYHGLTNTPKLAVVTTLPPADAPQLCFLSDRHDPPGDHNKPWPGTYWRPNGEVVEKTKELEDLRSTASAFTRRTDRHLNIFVLVRDEAASPSGEIDLLDDGGKPLSEQFLANPAYSGRSIKTDHFWQQFVLPMPEKLELPERGTIRLRYTSGTWRSLATFSASEQFSLLNAIGVTHVATGDDAAGHAFVSIYIRSPDGDRYQYKLVGHDKKKQTIRSSGTRQTGDLTSSYVLTFEFLYPRVKFTDFELLGRSKYTTDYKSISFHPGHITTPVMRQPDGSLTGTEQKN